MEAINPQKIKLLKLYELLRQHSDEDRPLSTNQLCAILYDFGTKSLSIRRVGTFQIT